MVATGGAEASTGGSPAGGLGPRPPDGGLTPARGVRAAHERFAKSLRADDPARTRDAAPHPGPAGAPTPEADTGTEKDKPGAHPRQRKAKRDSGARPAGSGARVCAPVTLGAVDPTGTKVAPGRRGRGAVQGKPAPRPAGREAAAKATGGPQGVTRLRGAAKT